MSDTTQIDAGLAVASVTGAAVGGVVGDAVEAAAVTTDQSAHASALVTAQDAVSALASAAEPALASLPSADAQKAVAGLGLLQTILSELKAVFAL